MVGKNSKNQKYVECNPESPLGKMTAIARCKECYETRDSV
jgi:hypothetical protein